MRPGISSTASIGDQDFNLTVKRYDIPLSGQGKQNQVTNFARTVNSLPAGNTATVTVFNAIPTAAKFLIQNIRCTAMLTSSANAAKSLNWLKCTLTASGSSSWGLSLFPVPSNFQQSTVVDFYCSPDSYAAEFQGPLLVQGDYGATLALSVIAYATIALNDIIQVQANIVWQPVN